MISPEEEAKVLAQLKMLEPIFHRFEHLQGRAPVRSDFEALAAPEFFEIGASGRLYKREFIMQTPRGALPHSAGRAGQLEDERLQTACRRP